jgi:MOSC domain-containing protein YiiM
MHVVSVNVGLPRQVVWRGRAVRTGIFKDPVSNFVPLRRLNLEGDAQADLSVHGGPDKAIYAYPIENYKFWRSELRGRELPFGIFGENLTTEGLIEAAVHVGDEFRVGTARLVITQPRMPCFKLGLRFDDPGMTKRFLASGRPGIYLAVLEEGEVGPGSPIELLHEDENRVTVTELLRLKLSDEVDVVGIRRALQVPALAAVWRREFEDLLNR